MTEAESPHIVASFDEDLARLRQAISEMGGLAEAQLADALRCVAQRNVQLARRVRDGDRRIDAKEHDIDELAVRVIALRQPMALDLRAVIAALKISSDLERIGDYAANVAKRTVALSKTPAVRPAAAIPRMGRQVLAMLKDVLDAYADADADKARRVWMADEEVDQLYNSVFRELLTYMMEDPRDITACTHLLFMAKNIERIGDHATNIAETIHFQVHGAFVETPRPKSDAASFAVVEPGDDAK